MSFLQLPKCAGRSTGRNALRAARRGQRPANCTRYIQTQTASASLGRAASTSRSVPRLAGVLCLTALSLAVRSREQASWIYSYTQPIASEASQSAHIDGKKEQRKVGKKEIEQHSTREDCWVCINDSVYDVTEFVEQHPGGQELILEHAGKDVTKLFNQLHPKGTLEHALSPFAQIGHVDPDSRPEVAQTDDDEDETETRRASLPPASSILNLSTFEKFAQEVLGMDSRAWVYISSWSDDGVSYRTTKDSYTHIRFLPRVGIPVGDVNATTELLGAPTPLPVYVSATGQNRTVHPDGELNSMRSAHRTGIVQMVSNGASVSLPELLEERERLAKRDNVKPVTFWWQIYIRRDRTQNEEQVKQAAEGKVDAIVLTLDAVALGNHEKNRNHPERLLAASNTPEVARGLKPIAVGTLSADLSWNDIDWIKQRAPGIPILVKGVLSVDDIALAKKHGASGVILSNHGGRQLDYAPPPIAVLARAQQERPELLREIDVYIDGGISRGTDVLKALCLGAKGVGLGRIPFYATACYGEEGVTRAFQIMSDELHTGMQLLGAKKISDLRPEMLEIMPGLLGRQPKSVP